MCSWRMLVFDKGNEWWCVIKNNDLGLNMCFIRFIRNCMLWEVRDWNSWCKNGRLIGLVGVKDWWIGKGIDRFRKVFWGGESWW